MTTVSIRERGVMTPSVVVSIDGQEYPITLTDPFDEKDEKRLEWYFEQFLNFPFVDQVRAREAAASITRYGEALFEQVFADRHAFARYQAALQQGVETLTFEIAGAPDFHRKHWEALKDPDLPQPFALQTPFVRRNLLPQPILAQMRSSPTINLLVVAARPFGARDVGYRVIARPLVDALHQANLHVRVDILRPGSYAALARHLEATQDRYGTGLYHVIHFDVHGALRSYSPQAGQEQAGQGQAALANALFFQARYGRPDIAPYEGVKAFLFLESEAEAAPDPVEASELARLLLLHQVPIVILNACQSGRQVGDRETSLGSQLMQAGIQTVLAMSYAVSVSAATQLMQELYTQLFAGADLSAAISSARRELFNRKARKGRFNQIVDLEDWLLPVVYQNQPQRLTPREFTPEESRAFYEQQAADYPKPKTNYAFEGRDLDVLSIERALLARNNLLLVRGMGGVGKTTLLHHLGNWWQSTGLVDQVFYFGYDVKAWTRQQIMDAVARQLLGEVEYLRSFQPLSQAAQQALLAERLRAHRHLLMLDNLESVTGTALAIRNTLTPDEQTALHSLLASLAGGKTLVLLGSRGDEAWLAPQTFGDNIYVLAGLDPEAASALAGHILEACNATHYRGDPALERLLTLLDGYPLPLEIVLANLAHKRPDEVLAALEAGLKDIDTTKTSKTASLLVCIDYSYGNLAPDAQRLLLCLAPFTGVLNADRMPRYLAALQAQPALAALPFAQWQPGLAAAQQWGLVAPDATVVGCFRLQPILPYFLRNQLETQPDTQRAIATAFVDYYADYAVDLTRQADAEASDNVMQARQALAMEADNLASALAEALAQRRFPVCHNLYFALTRYLATTNQNVLELKIGNQLFSVLANLPLDGLTAAEAAAVAEIVGDLGSRLAEAGELAPAQTCYERVIALSEPYAAQDAAAQRRLAGVHHGLGDMARMRGEAAQADAEYEQTYALYQRVGDECGQVRIRVKQGELAWQRRDWESAQAYFVAAQGIAESHQLVRELPHIFFSLGRLAEETGPEDQTHLAEALRLYTAALAISHDFQEPAQVAALHQQLGNVALRMGDLELAHTHYTEALSILIEHNIVEPQARVYLMLAELHRRRAEENAQDETEKQQAIQYYMKVFELSAQGIEDDVLAAAIHGLGALTHLEITVQAPQQ